MNKNEIDYGVFIKKQRVVVVTTLFIIATLTLSACSSTYTLSTNLDKENFKDYFSHSQVKVVEDESAFADRYKLIGMVEGQNCQEKSHHAPPSEIEARTQARKAAFGKQANAIIFTGCVLINDDQANQQCVASIVCYGKAYQVEQVKSLK
jgi:RcsF protein